MTGLAGGIARLIRGYQRFLSPLLPGACRFEPRCSEYARQALIQRGLIGGAWLAARRLLRCHPFHPGGYDPLPPPGVRAARDPSRTWKDEQSWPPF